MLLAPTLPSTNASHQLPPGTTGDDFSPTGPLMDKLLFKVYSDETAEFLQLAAGEIDFTDWALTKAFLDAGQPCSNNGFPNCPNIGLSSTQEAFEMFNFEFNLNESWWGFDFRHGLNPDGVQIRQAISHLLDKDSFIATDPTIGGFASKIDNPVSPSQLSGLDLPDFHLFDSLHPNTISAYNIAADPTGFAELDTDPITPGNQPSPDWKAALDHLAQVRDPVTHAPGFWRDTNGDGVIDTNLPTTTVDFFCRVDHAPRDRFCNGIASRLNQMFGKTVVNVFEKTISQVSSIVFSTSKPDDWHGYSAGYGLFPEWDHLWDFYASPLASDICGGIPVTLASNYDFVCDDGNDKAQAGLPGVDLREVSPGYFVNINENDYDALAYKVKFSPTLGQSKLAAKAALLRMGQMAFTLPVWSGASRFGYLKDPVVGGAKASAISVPDGKGWTGIINDKGVGTGFGATWDTAYSAQPAIVNTTRIGMRQGTLHTDWFKSQTQWEFMILTNLYSSLIDMNPYDPNQLGAGGTWSSNFGFGQVANSWVENISPAELGYNPDTVLGVAAGTVKENIRFNLRTDVFFHDGVQLTANDVKFTIEGYRDAPSNFFLPSVLNVVGVTCGARNTCTSQDFVADVHFNAVSFVFIKRIGGLPILPRHVWDTNNDGKVDSTKLGNSFDAMKNHALIGSGPYVCKDLVTGQLGGGCSSTGSSSTSVGDSIVLERFKANPLDPRIQFLRSVANFKEWNYADGSQQALTSNPLADNQVVDIQDVSAILLCFGQNAASGHPECQYWKDAAPVASDPDPTVDNLDTGIVIRWFGASQFDTTVGGTRWTFPLLWEQYLNIQPFPPTYPSIAP